MSKLLTDKEYTIRNLLAQRYSEDDIVAYFFWGEPEDELRKLIREVKVKATTVSNSNPTDTNQATDDTQKASTRTLSEQHAQHGTATSPIISDINQASEDEELRDKLLKIFDPYTVGDWTDNAVWRISNADTFIATMQEVERLIRTEKLKLLAEVRERVMGEDEGLVEVTKRNLVTASYFNAVIKSRNELRSNQRATLTKLEKELSKTLKENKEK